MTPPPARPAREPMGAAPSGVAYGDLWEPQQLRAVQEWLRRAWQAMRDLERGLNTPPPHNLIISVDDALKPWARPFKILG